MTFPLFALWGLLCAFTLRIRFSGAHLWEWFGIRFIICVAFNLLFAMIYFSISKLQVLPVLGYRPDVILEYPFIEWIAFFCGYIHVFAWPVERELRWWF